MNLFSECFVLFPQEALRSRGLKDDTTCLVVDIIPSDLPVISPTPRKKHNFLTSLLFGKKFGNSTNKATSKLSAVGVVEELFEEGSAMLAERYILEPCYTYIAFYVLKYHSKLATYLNTSQVHVCDKRLELSGFFVHLGLFSCETQ